MNLTPFRELTGGGESLKYKMLQILKLIGQLNGDFWLF